MLKSCSRCHKIHPYNYKCTKNAPIRQRTEDARFRSSNRWAKKSLDIRERSQWLCAVCKDQGRFVTDGLEVHHIEKYVDAPELGLEDSNLICLCVAHHKEADAGEIDAEYLKKLVEERDQ